MSTTATSGSPGGSAPAPRSGPSTCPAGPTSSTRLPAARPTTARRQACESGRPSRTTATGRWVPYVLSWVELSRQRRISTSRSHTSPAAVARPPPGSSTATRAVCPGLPPGMVTSGLTPNGPFTSGSGAAAVVPQDVASMSRAGQSWRKIPPKDWACPDNSPRSAQGMPTGRQRRGTLRDVSKPNLARRVAQAAEIALADHQYVTFLDVVTGLRWLRTRHVDVWRQGRAATLAELAAVDGDRLLTTAALLRDWAEAKGLRPVPALYVSGSRDRRPLRFTAHPEQEPFTVHWLSPEMSEARVRRLAERQAKPPDLVVVEPQETWTCAGCADTGPYLIMEDDRPHCLTCADLDHLVFLPSGNAALSR